MATSPRIASGNGAAAGRWASALLQFEHLGLDYERRSVIDHEEFVELVRFRAATSEHFLNALLHFRHGAGEHDRHRNEQLVTTLGPH